MGEGQEESTSGGADKGRGVLEGAFLLLEELGRQGEMGLTRLATETGLPKSTVHRLLDQLTGLGAVCRGARGTYRLGSRTFRLGQAWSPAPVLRAAAAQPMRHLATFTGGNVSVAILDAPRLMVVTGTPGPVDEVFSLRAGAVLPTATAAEAVISASNPRADLPEGQSRTEWNRRLRGARDQGVAFDWDNTVEPIACIAAPVHTPTGTVVAAVGIAVLDRRRLPSMADALRDTAARISTNLGRIPASTRALSPLTGPS